MFYRRELQRRKQERLQHDLHRDSQEEANCTRMESTFAKIQPSKLKIENSRFKVQDLKLEAVHPLFISGHVELMLSLCPACVGQHSKVRISLYVQHPLKRRFKLFLHCFPFSCAIYGISFIITIYSDAGLQNIRCTPFPRFLQHTASSLDQNPRSFLRFDRWNPFTSLRRSFLRSNLRLLSLAALSGSVIVSKALLLRRS